MVRIKNRLAAQVAVVAIALLAILALRISTAANEAPATQEAAVAADLTPTVLMQTSEGDFVIELDRKLAPRSVDNFLEYVQSGFYDGTIFHRVIDSFMIQGGGFTAAYERKETRPPIRNEANNGLKNRRYTISMARTNAPHSGTSQFFVNTVDNKSLDHTGATERGWGYAVFGRVISGKDVVDTINGTLTGPGGPFRRDAPQKQIIITKASIVDESAEKATQ